MPMQTLTVSEVADLLKLKNKHAVYRLVKRRFNPLPCQPCGKEFRFSLGLVEAWLENRLDPKMTPTGVTSRNHSEQSATKTRRKR